MEIRHLKTLVAIVDYGSFGAAGDAVFLTQSAVSQQVRAMEEFLGFKIFDRNIRPPALTAQGAILIENARKIVMEYDGIIQNLKGDKLAGTFSLGAFRGSLKGVLPNALRLLRDRQPNLHVHVKTALGKDLVASVESGGLDAAIIPSGQTLKNNLCWLPYCNERFVILAHTDVKTKGRTDKEILENSPYIKYFNQSYVSLMIEKEISRRNIRVNSRMDIDVLEPILGLVEQGLGISVVPEPDGSSPLPHNVQKIPFGNPQLQRRLGIIFQKDSPKENIVSLLRGELHRLSGSPNLDD